MKIVIAMETVPKEMVIVMKIVIAFQDLYVNSMDGGEPTIAKQV